MEEGKKGGKIILMLYILVISYLLPINYSQKSLLTSIETIYMKIELQRHDCTNRRDALTLTCATILSCLFDFLFDSQIFTLIYKIDE